MKNGFLTPAKKMRLALLPALLGVMGSTGEAWAQSCTLNLVNSLPLTVTDNVITVPGTIAGKEKPFQIDTAALDNQMGRDAVTDFGLATTDFTPAQSAGAAAFSSGQAALTNTAGTNTANGIPLGRFGAVGDSNGNGVAIYNDKGEMFHTWAQAPLFTLGAMQVTGQQFVVTDYPKAGSGGILSAGFFSKFDLDLNFAARRMNMFSSDHCKGQAVYWRAPGMAQLPFGFKDGKIAVRVTVNGKGMDAVIDTGAAHSQMQLNDASRMFDVSTDSAGVTPAADNLYAYKFKTLSFGQIAIGNPQIFLTRANLVRGTPSAPQTGTLLRTVVRQPTLVIGTDLLKLLHVYFAFGEGVIYITQGPELPPGDPKAIAAVDVKPQRP